MENEHRQPPNIWFDGVANGHPMPVQPSLRVLMTKYLTIIWACQRTKQSRMPLTRILLSKRSKILLSKRSRISLDSLAKRSKIMLIKRSRTPLTGQERPCYK
ncbi:uncharacterized protein LOC121734822 [Aricia agestis]|uniref:uncharacterized protein LOC121733728 n=1 Tax=Aricia agestis TaxID=91739 RepID=UPI001C20B54A|nr:uncharacterized protein LOC121733728 [Aricia agestis]XP_041981376.1 uncharacterized protein LOC121734822 [Aricia agestis]